MSTPQLLVGSYARKSGAGLYPLAHDPAGRWSIGEPCRDARNASFGTWSARHRLYYFVDEQADGAVTVLRRAGPAWRRVAHVPTGGEEPCYVALDHGENWLAAANYGSGSIALFRLDAGGLPASPPTMLRHSGQGPNPDRQDGPHAHCVCFDPDGRHLLHVDLGTDRILSHPFDPATGAIGDPVVAFRAPPGSGPRHLAFHPSRPLALLVSELASSLTILEPVDGGFAARAQVSTLPYGYAGESLAGHLSLNAAGDRVYVTNRGHDSVAVFAWDEAGTLTPLQHVPSGGASPRSFVLLECRQRFLLVNEEEENVTFFAIGPDGGLSPLDIALPVAGAAFVLAAAEEEAGEA